MGFYVKTAATDAEFDLIHELNYKTFVEEIPQHERNQEGRLIDRFHSENTYLIVMDGALLAGMIAVRGNRPFSLDEKIPNLDHFLPEGRKICEIRLLAVEKQYRGGQVFFLIMKQLAAYCMEAGYGYAIISGTTRQQKLYHHLGFRPFHPQVGKEGAYFIPMGASIEEFEQRLGKYMTQEKG